nr:hypothetical protein [Myxococcota bacterium]
CPRCLDTWAYDAECPRCDLPLVDELERGPVRPCAADPQVDAMLDALERPPGPPTWADRVGARVPVATISSLLAGGVLALPIHAPVATMLLAYGLFLFGVEAYGAATRTAVGC